MYTVLADTDMKTKLTKQFKSQHFGIAAKLGKKGWESTVVRLAAKRLAGRSLQLRRKYAGLLGQCEAENKRRFWKGLPH